MSESVLETVPLGAQWVTVDPFLFCVHHLDEYPAGNEHLGPAASLAGRDIGMDFAGIDGWRMYHGATVPGFPQHPHRGFETVTFVRRASSTTPTRSARPRASAAATCSGSPRARASCTARCSRCSTATARTRCELFQIWLNLPAADKMVEPYFTMLWNEDLPRHRRHRRRRAHDRGHGDRGRARRACARRRRRPTRGRRGPRPTSRSGTSCCEPGAQWTLPPAAGPDTVRTLYVFEGARAHRRPRPRRADRRACCASTTTSTIAGGPDGAEVLVLQGRPIGEPVAQHGPFVMNDEAGIEQAFADYRATEFGGWPWPTDDPVHRARRRALRAPSRRPDRSPAGRLVGARRMRGRLVAPEPGVDPITGAVEAPAPQP